MNKLIEIIQKLIEWKSCGSMIFVSRFDAMRDSTFFKRNFTTGPSKAESKMTEQRVIELMREGRLFGFFEISIKVPESHDEKFREWPPLFTKKIMGRDDLDKQSEMASGHL